MSSAPTIPDSLRAGIYEYAITVATGESTISFPCGLSKRPEGRDYYARNTGVERSAAGG